jgi:hypothetical protein
MPLPLYPVAADLAPHLAHPAGNGYVEAFLVDLFRNYAEASAERTGIRRKIGPRIEEAAPPELAVPLYEAAHNALLYKLVQSIPVSVAFMVSMSLTDIVNCLESVR